MKRIIPKLLLSIGLMVSAVAFQEPDGTTTCNNFRANAHKCACGRAMMCDRQHNPGSAGDPDMSEAINPKK